MTLGMNLKLDVISLKAAATPAVCLLWARKASMSSGGSSVVVKTVQRIDAIKTMAPMAKAQCTEGGISPSGAVVDTPKVLISQGKLLAIHVPIPIISV